MKDLYNHLTLVQAVAPVVVKTGTVPDPAAVDLAGYNSAVIEMSCGAKPSGEDGAITLKLEHADDSTTPGTAGTFSSVAAADVQGATPDAGIIKTLATATEALAAVYKFGYVGGKRHIRLTIAAAAGNTNGTIIGVTVIKGHGLDAPPIS